MRNVWKGLVVGGLTGVGAGVLLDSLHRANQKASEISKQVKEHAPEAGRWVHSVTEKAADWVQDSDIPEHVRDTAHRVKESEPARRGAKAAGDAVTAAKRKVQSA
jgi:hypothetical protein